MPVTDVRRGPLAALAATPEGRLVHRQVTHPGHAMHLARPALRTADGHHRDERRASWLELFFDLAFAGAVGQLVGAFQSHPDLAALAGFALLFTPIWWLWVQLTFYADRHETEDAAYRIATLIAILLCVALAASAPRALAGHPAGFVVAFACLRGLQLFLYGRAWRHLPATRPLYSCYLVCFSGGGVLWLASLTVGGSARYALWGTALLTDAVGSLAMLAPRRRLPLNNAHLADRFQIFVLIVLGESMARLISAASARPWSLSLAIVLTAAFLTLAALWWGWLTAADRCALNSPAAIARFTALNLPLVAGIAAASAGLHTAILAADGASTIAVGPRAALYGGVSILPARQRPSAVREDDPASQGRQVGGRPRRDGPGVHGRDRRARLPGPPTDRRARARAGRRSAPQRASRTPSGRRPCLQGVPMPAVLTSPAATTLTRAVRWDYAANEPTLATAWQAVTGTTIGDELLEWPPDLLALTEVILERSEAYRFALSPPAGTTWPPASFPEWPDVVTSVARQWSAWIENKDLAIPGLLAREWEVLRARAGAPLSDVTEARDWRLCEALLTLHAISDEACAGLGVALDAAGADGVRYRARGRELLARTGSLARIPARVIRVLPKAGTPGSGSSARVLSRYAAVQVPGVEARWHKTPVRGLTTGPQARKVNYLLLPWPLRIRASDFRPVAGPLQRLAHDPFGFFEFIPSERLDLDLADRTLAAARDQAGPVDVVILPESAVEHSEIDGLETLLARHDVTTLITGVREHPAQPGWFPRNWVHIGVSVGGQWTHIQQSKHHRWSLDDTQIRQYHLAGALQPYIRWWEAMEVPRRSVQFVELGGGITLTSLVCEDLAQTDEVAGVIRAVGPTIVVTPLLDGPQLSSRWGARYAGVLADDPGSAVLTLTSLGMAQRSRPPGHDPTPVVALWKGPRQHPREIPLDRGAHGILLSATADPAVRRSFDGRRPGHDGSEFSGMSAQQIRASSTGWQPPPAPAGPPPQPMLTADELTILTSWAEAIAEALAFAPTSIEALGADAQPGARWRDELRVCEPSPPLRNAINGITQAARTALAAGGDLPLNTALLAAEDSQLDQSPLDGLARAVLRSALQQRQTRQPAEGRCRPTD